jgi:membrane-anchored glycerophosphoryl diester phosphodiesterase (GDPDase)
LIQGSVYLLLVLVVSGVTFAAVGRVSASTSQNVDEITAGAFGLIGIAAVVPALLAVIASAIVQGIIVLEVSRGTVGEKLTFRELWRRAHGRIWALIGWSALLILASTIIVGALILIIVVLLATLGNVGIVAAVLVGIFGGLGLLVVFVWLSTKLTFVPSALMIERLSIGQSVRRSWTLTSGFFWRTFGILALVSVIIGVVSQVVSTPLTFLAPMVGTLVDPQGQNGSTAAAVVIGFAVLAIVITVVFQAITSVVSSATTALLYIDLRIRKEGLDLDLSKFLEERQAGHPDPRDPFLHRGSAPAGVTGTPARQSESGNGSPWG